MRPGGAWNLAVTALLLSAMPAATASADDWIRVETPNFTLYSNAGEKQTVRVAHHLERFREVLGQVTHGMKFNSPYPTRIYVFRSEKAFNPYKLRADGTPDDGIAGYFQPSREGNYVAVDLSGSGRPFSIVYHEYLHYFLRNNVPGVPLWLNEGLAEFYSTFEVRGDRAEIGRPVEYHLHRLTPEGLMPLQALFAVEHGSPEYNENDRRGVFYGQSWALTHMLLTGGQARREQFNRLFRGVAGGQRSADALSHAFGTDLESVARELAKYIDRSSYEYLFLDLGEPLADAQVSVSPMDPAAVQVRLADLLVHRRPVRGEEVRAHVGKTLAVSPERADAYVVLGRLEEREERWEEAAAAYRKATELDDGNAVAWIHRGQLAVERFLRGPDRTTTSVGQTPEVLEEARTFLQRGLAIEPDVAEAQLALGRTYFFDREGVRPGIEALTRAARALPSRDEIFVDLVYLAVRDGDRGLAEGLIGSVLEVRGKPELARTARGMLVELDFRESNELAREGKLDEAQAVLRRALQRTDDPAVRSTIESQLAALKRSSEGRSTTSVVAPRPGSSGRSIPGPAVRSDPQRDTYNQAVEAANLGDLEEALRLFEKVLKMPPEGEVRTLAERQIAHLREAKHRTALTGRYREGAALSNADCAEALAVFEEILSSNPPEDLREQIKSFLPDLRRAAAANRK